MSSKTTPAALLITPGTALTPEAHGLKIPAQSPLTIMRQSFALTEIAVEYSRPGARGRTIYGDLVPYGKMWRTGANGCSKIAFGEDVTIAGSAVPTGTYAIYTIPGKDNWEVILYKDLHLGGNVGGIKKEDEMARFTVKPAILNDFEETFTIGISNITATTCVLYMDWEKTRVSLNITADIDARVMKAIETNVTTDSRPYYLAATYYFTTNKDLATAHEWIDKGIAVYPGGYWMILLKARIQAKQNDKKGALASAEQAITLATQGKDDAIVRQGHELIADLKK